ncbi:MAG: zinc ribbon domain-containing protein [Acidobacteriota bacterium]|nr:zinc ribbon domain-containing protein [Acidobacteriota bacterium]
MPDFCTCGARLPEDARFCHKCGKPQYDYPGFEVEPVAEIVAAPAVAAAPPPPPPSTEISFRNRTAVRVGFLAALVAFILFVLPLPFPLPRLMVAFLAAGFLAVYLYGRRTGQKLSIRSGARMGWMTGIFSFVIVTVQFTAGVLATSKDGGIAAILKAQLPANDANTEQVLKLIQEPSALAVMMIFVLLMMFLLLTVLPTLGGALGAKVLTKQQ